LVESGEGDACAAGRGGAGGKGFGCFTAEGADGKLSASPAFCADPTAKGRARLMRRKMTLRNFILLFIIDAT
jgi:hypothetical protein